MKSRGESGNCPSQPSNSPVNTQSRDGYFPIGRPYVPRNELPSTAGGRKPPSIANSRKFTTHHKKKVMYGEITLSSTTSRPSSTAVKCTEHSPRQSTTRDRYHFPSRRVQPPVVFLTSKPYECHDGTPAITVTARASAATK